MIYTRDIKLLFQQTIASDPTMVTLLGISADDPRVYWYYQADVQVVDSSESGPKGYITYADLGQGEKAAAVREPVFSFNCWARRDFTAEDIAKRMGDLFDQKEFTTPAPSSRAVYTKVIHSKDIFQEEPSMAGKILHIKVGLLEVGT